MSIRPTSPQGPPDQPGESPFSLFGDELSNPPAGVLRSRLVETAFSRALLDVTYWTHDSPVGALFLAATDAGVCRLAFTQENHDGVLEDLANSVSPRMMRDPRRFDIVVRQLDEYFEQRRQRFDVSLDLRLLKGFRRAAIDHLSDIEYGSTASYAELARISGSPRAVRAAGWFQGGSRYRLMWRPCLRPAVMGIRSFPAANDLLTRSRCAGTTC